MNNFCYLRRKESLGKIPVLILALEGRERPLASSRLRLLGNGPYMRDSDWLLSYCLQAPPKPLFSDL